MALEGGAVTAAATAARARLRQRIAAVEASTRRAALARARARPCRRRAAEKAETAPLSARLARTRHDDELLTIDEARSAEVGAAAAATAARAAVECGVLRADLAELEAGGAGGVATAAGRGASAAGARRAPLRMATAAAARATLGAAGACAAAARRAAASEAASGPGRAARRRPCGRASGLPASPTLELLEPNAQGDGPQQDALGNVVPTISLELGRVTATELGVASLLGYAPSPPPQAALQAATCFTLHSLRGAPLHLKAADRAQLSLWWFGLASLCATAPAARLSPGALLWRVARLRYAESVGARQGEPGSWMQL